MGFLKLKISQSEQNYYAGNISKTVRARKFRSTTLERARKYAHFEWRTEAVAQVLTEIENRH